MTKITDGLQQRAFISRNRPMEIWEVVKRLRMHGVIPLHIGDQDRATLAGELAENPLFSCVVDQVWLLSAAPVVPEVNDALKDAAKRGMNRWN